MINEYSRPGNLELFTYVDRAMIPAVVEQLLPDTFQLRLQQYKPDWLKATCSAGCCLGVVNVEPGVFVLFCLQNTIGVMRWFGQLALLLSVLSAGNLFPVVLWWRTVVPL